MRLVSRCIWDATARALQGWLRRCRHRCGHGVGWATSRDPRISIVADRCDDGLTELL